MRKTARFALIQSGPSIREKMKPVKPVREERLSLNAYHKASESDYSESEESVKGDKWLDKDKSVDLDDLQLKEKKESDDCNNSKQILRMDYDMCNLSMIIVLPSVDDFNFHQLLTMNEIKQILGKSKEDVSVEIPLFKIESKFDVKKV